MADWEKLIEENREEVEEAIKDALRLSYENRNLCRVIIEPDGKLHIYEDVSHGRETIEGDYLEIANFDNPFDDPTDDFSDNEEFMVEVYEGNLTESERETYEKAKEEYERNFDEEMSDSQKVKWITKNCENAAKIVREKALNILCSDLDYNEIIAHALAEA